jgi:thymidylate kinase
MGFNFKGETKMLIVVEGVDKSGKSTLVEKLVKGLPQAFLMKVGDRPKDNSKDEKDKIKRLHWKMLRTYVTHFRDSTLILDRSIISEIVYSKIKRGYEAGKDKEVKEMVKYLADLKPFIIYCRTSIDETKLRMFEQEEDYLKMSEVEPLMIEYDNVMDGLGVSVFPYDYRVTSAEQVIETIKRRMENEDGV